MSSRQRECAQDESASAGAPHWASLRVEEKHGSRSGASRLRAARAGGASPTARLSWQASARGKPRASRARASSRARARARCSATASARLAQRAARRAPRRLALSSRPSRRAARASTTARGRSRASVSAPAVAAASPLHCTRCRLGAPLLLTHWQADAQPHQLRPPWPGHRQALPAAERLCGDSSGEPASIGCGLCEQHGALL